MTPVLKLLWPTAAWRSRADTRRLRKTVHNLHLRWNLYLPPADPTAWGISSGAPSGSAPRHASHLRRHLTGQLPHLLLLLLSLLRRLPKLPRHTRLRIHTHRPTPNATHTCHKRGITCYTAYDGPLARLLPPTLHHTARWTKAQGLHLTLVERSRHLPAPRDPAVGHAIHIHTAHMLASSTPAMLLLLLLMLVLLLLVLVVLLLLHIMHELSLVLLLLLLLCRHPALHLHIARGKLTSTRICTSYAY